MRLLRQAISCLILLAAFAPVRAVAQAESGSDANPVLRNARQVLELARSRAHRLGTSAGPDPDTVYVGKSYTNHTAPDNYWNIYTGTYLPGHERRHERAVGLGQLGRHPGAGLAARLVAAAPPVQLDRWPDAHRRPASVVGDRPRQPRQLRDQPAVVGQAHVRRRRLSGTRIRAANAGVAVPWTPLSGTKSAWCGLREHGDQSVKDAVTGQAFNQDAVQFLHDATAAGGGSAQQLPRLPGPDRPDAVPRHRDDDRPVADGLVQVPHAHVHRASARRRRRARAGSTAIRSR